MLTGPYLDATLIGAAETAAALGGTFLKVAWDANIKDHAFIVKVDADLAVPEFAFGFLKSVQFWHNVATEGSTVWRHVEEHFVDSDGIGLVRHALYMGRDDNVGIVVSLTDRDETRSFAEFVDENGCVSTETPGLSAVYLPNRTPNAIWRKDPLGANLGRSDFEGILQPLDAVNEAFSSLMRDIRLSKSTLIISEKLLEDLGVGEGLAHDIDREIFTQVKDTSVPDGDGNGMPITQVQFAVRVEDFQKVINFLKGALLSIAGYSSQTFGLVESNSAMTATETNARERASHMTREAKVRLMAPQLSAIALKLLLTDAAKFDTGITVPDGVVIESIFADAVQPDAEAISAQNASDFSSQSASTVTRVGRAHPDWSPAQVKKEAELILAEHKKPEPAAAAPAETVVEPAEDQVAA